MLLLKTCNTYTSAFIVLLHAALSSVVNLARPSTAAPAQPSRHVQMSPFWLNLANNMLPPSLCFCRHTGTG